MKMEANRLKCVGGGLIQLIPFLWRSSEHFRSRLFGGLATTKRLSKTTAHVSQKVTAVSRDSDPTLSLPWLPSCGLSSSNGFESEEMTVSSLVSELLG
jgi:hypothetical protein